MIVQFELQTATMRRKNPSQRVPCHRQHCVGASNEQDNFLSVTSRGNTPTQSKNKSKKIKKKDDKKDKDAVRNILQQSYQHLREENQQLNKKLTAKKKKIEELKIKIKDYEEEIKRLHEQNHNPQLHRKTSHESSESKKYAKMVQDAQGLAKETLDRYKKIEEEYFKYRQNTEKKIDKLRSEKQKLITEGAEAHYNKQIEQLKHQLTRFKEDQLAVNSMKSLHQHQSHHEDKLKLEVATLKATVSTLKADNERLKQYAQQLEDQLEERTMSAQNKEREMKSNLDAINEKITNWEQTHHMAKEEALHWQHQYNILLEKYRMKKLRHRENNGEWAQIFKQFIEEIDALKQELDSVSQKNAKLVKMCGHA